MARCITIISFTVVILISIIATVKPDLLMFINRIPYGDKVSHFLLFGMLGTIATIQSIKYGKVGLIIGLSLTLIFAVADETLQIFFDNRNFSWLDLFMGLVGISLFSMLTLKIYTLENS